MFQMDVLQRAGLPEQQCAALQEAWTHCGKIYQRPLHDQIQITCVGLYNAGKSTLLNAITQSDYFPTGDIPTTREIAVYKQKNCAYVDTPGLNANPNDDSTTQKALEDTDLLVFVSCIQNGGLTSAEAQWLRRARQIFGSDARMKERTLFVISQCGRMEETGVEKVVHKYRQDIKKVLNFYLESLYPLDVHIWQSGVEQNEPDLKNFSKFDIFKQALKNVAFARAAGDKIPEMADLQLADTVNASKTLLKAVGVPGQIVIYHQVGVLQVDAAQWLQEAAW